MEKILNEKVKYFNGWKSNIVYFYNDLYKQRIIFIFPKKGIYLCPKIINKFFLDYFKIKNCISENSVAARMTLIEHKNENIIIIILHQRDVEEYKQIAALSHEALHATAEILISRGMKLDNNLTQVEEPFCYMIEWIMSKLLFFLR